MEATREGCSAPSVAVEHSPTLQTYANFLRTIVDENPEFLLTLERLEGGISSEAILAHVRP